MKRQFLFVLLISALVAPGLPVAQDEFPPEPNPEEEPEKKKGSLLPRPEEDVKTALWVSKLGAARPEALTTRDGVLLHLVMSPDGERFYYFREVAKSDGKDGKPADESFVLFTVGPDRAETKVADTGADTTPPLFLGDGRILFMSRAYDLNDDGQINELDDATLLVSNRDGGNLRNVATLAPGETPVAVWRGDRDVLVSTPGDEDANGWIVSLNLVRGDRERVVRGFNVELVLDDGRLLIERQQSKPAPPPQGRRWNQPATEDEAVEPPLPTLLDHSEHIIFDPSDGSESALYSPSRRSRIVVHAEGSWFGHQEPDNEGNTRPRMNFWGQESRSSASSEILIVDDPQHHDVRATSARYDYLTLGWISERGLLFVEEGNLGSRLMLFDHALKAHRLADFDLNARGFVASRDGLTIGWLAVEDTDKNGYLQPWKDHSRLFYLRIE
ncbi:MAG: hypothetical protein K8I27_17385 [Planctomycetes bacterium]|nr:hypothetical protein [Planctomycetota bacterium]